MDEIRDVVTSIVKGCKLGGLEVQDVLAAFVARTIVESSTSSFALDKSVTPERREQIVLESIEKLLERDNPALETLKMQVEYDSSFLKEDLEALTEITGINRNKLVVSAISGLIEKNRDRIDDHKNR